MDLLITIPSRIIFTVLQPIFTITKMSLMTITYPCEKLAEHFESKKKVEKLPDDTELVNVKI